MFINLRIMKYFQIFLQLKSWLILIICASCIRWTNSIRFKPSPCPAKFNYESTTNDDRWYGDITFPVNTSIDGSAIRIELNRPSQLLLTTAGPITTKDNQVYFITHDNVLLEKGSTYKLIFMVKFDKGSEVPMLETIHFNGQRICPPDLVTLSLGGGSDYSSSRPDIKATAPTDVISDIEKKTKNPTKATTRATYSNNNGDNTDYYTENPNPNRLTTNKTPISNSNNFGGSNNGNQGSSSYNPNSNSNNYGGGSNNGNQGSSGYNPNSNSNNYGGGSNNGNQGSGYNPNSNSNNFGGGGNNGNQGNSGYNPNSNSNNYGGGASNGNQGSGGYNPSTSDNFGTGGNNGNQGNSGYNPGTSSNIGSNSNGFNNNNQNQGNNGFGSGNSNNYGNTGGSSLGNNNNGFNTGNQGTVGGDSDSFGSNSNSNQGNNGFNSGNSNNGFNNNFGTNGNSNQGNSGSTGSGGGSQGNRNPNQGGDVIFTNGGSATGRPNIGNEATVSREVACGTVSIANPLITLAQNSEYGQWPWHVALFMRDEVNPSKSSYICGGSLVSKNRVITAAHCVSLSGNRIVNPNSLTAYMGKYNINTDESTSQKRTVSALKVNPEYNKANFHNDIAILSLKDDVEFTNYVRPICLWEATDGIQDVVGKNGIVVGWGYNEYQQLNQELKQATMPIVSTEKCARSDPQFFSEYVSDNAFCAGSLNGTGPCKGDSGGGLVLKRNNSWYLRGIVSVSAAPKNGSVCNNHHYIVFTDTAKYTDFIKRNI